MAVPETWTIGQRITVRKVLAAPPVANVQITGAEWLWPVAEEASNGPRPG
jgi:hypothetical protein